MERSKRPSTQPGCLRNQLQSPSSQGQTRLTYVCTNFSGQSVCTKAPLPFWRSTKTQTSRTSRSRSRLNIARRPLPPAARCVTHQTSQYSCPGAAARHPLDAACHNPSPPHCCASWTWTTSATTPTATSIASARPSYSTRRRGRGARDAGLAGSRYGTDPNKSRVTECHWLTTGSLAYSAMREGRYAPTAHAFS